MENKRRTEKFLIDRNRFDQVRDDFSGIAQPDQHTRNGIYRVRSLYFDNDQLQALKDRQAQIDNRKKYRIRLYNHDPNFIRLEEKHKVGDIGTKTDAFLSIEEVEKIINGDTDWLKDSEVELLRTFYDFIKNDHIKPKVIVEYTRVPLVQKEKGTRYTLDYDIKASKEVQDFLKWDLDLDDIIEDQAVIEVKWPGQLPEEVSSIIKRENLVPVNFSKYTSTYDYLTKE